SWRVPNSVRTASRSSCRASLARRRGSFRSHRRPVPPPLPRSFFATLSVLLVIWVCSADWAARRAKRHGEAMEISWRIIAAAQPRHQMLYRFGDCELDMERFELRRAGRRETLEPKVLELLAHLVANRDRVVTRRELNDRVWRGRIVTDAAVNSCIKAARAHIGDDGKTQILIRTVHRKGYRFVGAVTERSANPAREVRGDVEPIIAEGDCLDGLELTLPSQPSIAVLPFRLADDEHARAVLADGLTHEVITRIARARWL